MVTTIRLIAEKRVARPTSKARAQINSTHIDSSQFNVAGRWLNGNRKRSWMSANQFSPLNFSSPDSKNSQARKIRRVKGAIQVPARSRFRCRPLTVDEMKVLMDRGLLQIRDVGRLCARSAQGSAWPIDRRISSTGCICGVSLGWGFKCGVCLGQGCTHFDTQPSRVITSHRTLAVWWRAVNSSNWICYPVPFIRIVRAFGALRHGQGE